MLVGVAVALGWRPDGNWLLALGRRAAGHRRLRRPRPALAGRCPGEAVLAAANGLYLVLLLLGGMVFPLDRLPGPLRAVARLLPAAALSDALPGALSAGARCPAGPGWCCWRGPSSARSLAARTFRWE